MFLGMISGLTKEMDGSVVYAGTFLTVNGSGLSTIWNLKRAAFSFFGRVIPKLQYVFKETAAAHVFTETARLHHSQVNWR
jgi:hypothetical protein